MIDIHSFLRHLDKSLIAKDTMPPRDFVRRTPAEISKILSNQLSRFKIKGINLTWDNPLLHYLSEKGYEPYFNARPLKRLIQQEIVNPLSKEILEGKIKDNKTVKLILKNNTIDFELL